MATIVERFLHWARTAPVARRCDAAEALARGYLVSPMTPQERDDVEAAMTVLLDDPAPEVRQALAGVLAESDLAPHHVILALAADAPAIATIVVERSPVILDSELVELLGSRDSAVHAAIARRPYVSRAVCAAISEVACVEVCRELVGNSSARLPRFSLDRMIERHGDDALFRAMLLERDDLPLGARQLLLARLSSSLRSLMVDKEWLPAERAEAVTRDARERATIAVALSAASDEVAALVDQLIGAGQLTPALLMRAAVSGHSDLFEAALAALATIPRHRVRAIIGGGRNSSLQALLQKAGLPDKMHPAFAAAVKVLRNTGGSAGPASDYRRATSLIDAVVSDYQRRRDRETDHILALLRRFAAEAKRSAARGYAHQLLQAA